MTLPFRTAVFGLLIVVVVVVIFNQYIKWILNYYYYVDCRRLGTASG